MIKAQLQTLTLLLVAGVLLTAGCDGDGDGSGGTGGTGAGPATTGGTAGTGGSTGGTGAAGGTGGSTGGSGGTGGEGATGGSGGTGGTGGGMVVDCEALPPGPIEPEVFLDVFNGSEDIAMDGKGHIVGKDGQAIVSADAAGQTTQIATDVPTAYGLRYRPDGFLVVALPQAGKVIEVAPDGTKSDVVTGLNGPNGVYPDLQGNVWVTEIGGNKVSRINPDKSVDVIISGNTANSANGVVLDSLRNLLFYTNYSSGRVRSVDITAAGGFTAVDVVQIQGASLDGMVMDLCGNLYVVDQGNSDLYRIKLDAAGAIVGNPELLASFPKNVANAQFGTGPDLDPLTLYVAGNPGTVYALNVGVPGAKVATPP